MQQPVCLFCKSYLGDLQRIVRLVESLRTHNQEGLGVTISVPSAHLADFEATFAEPATPDWLNWITDEDILAAQPDPQRSLQRYQEWDGRLSQQVIKSEFWRLGWCENYVCIDSDSVFIRDFGMDTFINPQNGQPYTVHHQAKELLQLAENRGIHKVLEQVKAESAHGKALFDRIGPDFDFSPTPVIWSAKVWQDLYEHHLKPKGQDFWDAIEQFPSELRWYGEALLHFQSVPLQPIEPLFRVYHYDWQYARMKRLGETPETLRKLYWGMVIQSNWDFDLDHGDQAKRKRVLSRLARRLRRLLAQFR